VPNKKHILVLLMSLIITTAIIGTSVPTYAACDGQTATIDEILGNQNPDGGWKKYYNVNTGEWKKSTIDNGATYTEIRRLAQEYNKTQYKSYLNPIKKGINFLLNMQYDNGGWPEIYQGQEYHAYIDYNDDSMINVMFLLDEVAKQTGDFTFIDDELAKKCEEAVKKGIDCVLKTQIVYNGEKQAWCQQYDPVTLEPAAGRAFELIGNSASESVGIVRFLMSIEKPSSEVKDAINSAVAWFKKVQIKGIRVEKQGGDVVVVEDPTAKPIWARFYEIGTDRPFFSTIDGEKKYALAEINLERRTGYSWYGYWPENLINNEYPEWLTRDWDVYRNIIWCRK